MATIDEIKQQAEAVKNASHVGENTALRVGGVLVGLCECMKNLSGGGTSGGSGVSLGTLLTKLNSDNPFPTASGQVLTYDGSNFIWKASTGSGGGTISVSGNGTMVDSAVSILNVKYPSGLSDVVVQEGDGVVDIDLSKVAGSGGSGSIQVAQTPEYAGGSESWVSTTKLRFVGITGTKPTIRTNSEKSCVDVGIPVGSGSGSSGTTSGKLRFYKDSSEESWNGESDFKIIFGNGLNVTWDSHSQITLSATGGSSGGSSGGSVSWADVTNKPSTFTPSSHTHLTNDINGLDSYVKGTKVNNATNADKAKQLAIARTIWGQSFDGTDNITGNLKMGSAGGGSIQLWMNGGNMLDRTDNTLHIGYGLKESSNGEIHLDAYVTRIYTDNLSRHYDFKSNVFDVNTNAIHFGSGASGGKISWDRTNNAFKIEGNVYATGGITALGVSNSATTTNNVDFTFKSVTSPIYKFTNESYLTETSENSGKDNTLKLYHADSTQYIRLSNSYEIIDNDDFLGTIIDSNCMSFMNADWYYFDNSVVARYITTNGISFCDEDRNVGSILSGIAISKVTSQTRLVFTIDNIQYYVNAN